MDARSARERALLPRRVALVAVTLGGARHAARLSAAPPDSTPYVSDRWRAEAGPHARPLEACLGPTVAQLFGAYDGLVFFTALGVAVRLMAPCLRSKREDPAVVVVDDAARYAISALSGHRGGANALAERVGALLGATPIVTTASEVHGTLPVDLLGRDLGWRIENLDTAKAVAAALVNGERVGLVQEAGELDWWDGPLPATVQRYATLEELAAADCSGLVITDRLLPGFEAAASRWVVYRPRTLVLGLGASSGVEADEIEALARAAIAEAGVAWASLASVATLDRKLSEPGVVAFAERHGLPLHSYGAAELARVPVPHPSAAVRSHVGTPSVCEAAAQLAAGSPLLLTKRKSAHATVALARRAPIKCAER